MSGHGRGIRARGRYQEGGRDEGKVGDKLNEGQSEGRKWRKIRICPRSVSLQSLV